MPSTDEDGQGSGPVAHADHGAPPSLPGRIVGLLPEKAYRILGVLFFAGCAAWRATAYGNFANKYLWALETLIYTVIAASYAFRLPPRSGANNWRETVVPLAGALWPFLLLSEPRGPFGLRHQTVLLWIMCAGTGIAVWGYLCLNEAFSILVEARAVKTGGPYRWIRHPVYAGQILTACAVTAWRFSWWTVALCLAFAFIQAYRAALEEKKLAAAFPAYERYGAHTGMFLPRLRSRSKDED